MARDLALVITFFAALIGVSLLLTGFFIPAVHSATLSGRIVTPESDMGYRARVYDMKVRVEGTEISADVIPLNHYEADFSVSGDFAGPVTLLLIEKSDQDAFTQASKRVEVNVTGDTVVSFNLAYHWKNLAGYPSPWGTEGYGEWTPHFVSDQVGFILFRVRGTGIDPERVEIYRTVDGGGNWDEIGHWLYETVPYPDFLDRSFHFVDENHGVVQAMTDSNPSPDVVWYLTQGVLYTSDGGQNWQYAPFPNPPDSYGITIGRFAHISPDQLIAAGKVGLGVQGYSGKHYNAIWESIDGGVTWELKIYWDPVIGGCTGLGANPDGKATAFFTPHWAGGGVERSVVHRDTLGNWTRQVGNSLVVNSGYGPADVPMVGDAAWVTNLGPGQLATLPGGLYRSNDAGLNWTMISDALLQYMDFGTMFKGFGLGGGPAYVSYDGGVTWLYQSAGGGMCCHINNIFAFNSIHAVWHDIGVGDPNTAASLFTYVEPWEGNFEVLTAVTLANGFALKGDTNVPAASYKLFNHGPVPINVKSIKLNAFGVGHDSTGIGTVKLWWDKNANGSADADDALIDSGTYTGDDGVITFSLGTDYILQQFVPFHLLVTYDISNNANNWDAFGCFIRPDGVEAETFDTQTPVLPTAPVGHQLPGRITTVPSAFDDIPTEHWAKDYVYALAESGITGGCGDPGFCPDDPVTRAQMAVFIETSLGVLLAPPCVGDVFLDVNQDLMTPAFCGYIERLASDGITGGCGEGNYCPNKHITRAEMAVFIEAALRHPANICTGRFEDVPLDSPFCGFIERLGDDGVTGGCTATSYCPDAPVTRAEMAVFLVAAPPPLMP